MRIPDERMTTSETVTSTLEKDGAYHRGEEPAFKARCFIEEEEQ